MNKPGIVVLISGGGSNLQAIIDAVACGEINADIRAVISNKANAFGLERAKQATISTHCIDHNRFSCRETFDAALASCIDQYNPDLVILAGFMRILTSDFTSHYLGKMINIHPSLLPKYQGLHTHQRAIDAQDTQAGVTVHFVTAQLDGGPNIIQAHVPIESQDTAKTLAQKVLVKEHIIFPRAINWFCQQRLTLQQNQVYLDNKALAACGLQLES